MSPARFYLPLLFTLVCITGGSQDVFAQVAPASIGVPIGGFRLFPSLSIGAAYDDNVFRTDGGARGDTFFQFQPDLVLNSNWSQHSLGFEVSAQDYRYLRLTDESHTDWLAKTNGRLDVQRGTTITGLASYQATHELRSSPDQPGSAIKPTPYDVTHAEIDAGYHPFRLGFDAGATFDRYNYESTLLSGGGILSNRDRDRDEWHPFVRATYEFSPGYTTFLRATYDQISYDLSSDRSGLNRSSTGDRVDTGLDLALTDLVMGEVSAGYLRQQYKAPLVDVSDFAYGAALNWTPTPQVRVNLTASRVPTETILSGVAATDDQSIALRVDYAFLREVSVQAGFSYLDSAFRGTSRDDRTTGATLGLNYFMNRYLTVNAKYVLSRRDSNLTGAGFHDNTLSAALIGHL
jgi:hypothetical protein